jgi:hypothetical protein
MLDGKPKDYGTNVKETIHWRILWKEDTWKVQTRMDTIKTKLAEMFYDYAKWSELNQDSSSGRLFITETGNISISLNSLSKVQHYALSKFQSVCQLR